MLNAHQRAEARKRVKGGESLRIIAKTFGVDHATIARLGGRRRQVRRRAMVWLTLATGNAVVIHTPPAASCEQRGLNTVMDIVRRGVGR
jgi:hypothetical protein